MWLLSDKASYVTGDFINVTGGGALMQRQIRAWAMSINVTTQPSAADPAITEAIADFALAASFAEPAAAVQRESVRTVVNWVGCALGGAPTPTVEAAINGLQSYSSPGRCRVIGRRERFDRAGRRDDQLPRIGGARVRRHASGDHHASDRPGDFGAARARRDRRRSPARNFSPR